MITRATIAAATRVIQYAAALPIVLSPGLMPSSKAAAQGNADGLLATESRRLEPHFFLNRSAVPLGNGGVGSVGDCGLMAI